MTAVLRIVLVLSLVLTSCGSGGGSDSGDSIGAETASGAGGNVIHVTTLDDAGPGSLRDAISQAGSYVVFDVAGTIDLSSALVIGVPSVTIDGSTAPSPGITLRQAGIRLDGSGIHDIVLRDLRIRKPGVNYPEGDGITIKNGAHNVIIDHVSVDGCRDGNIDVTRSAHDITVQWSVLSGCPLNMLVNYQAHRVTIHHNLFVDSQWRNPNISYTDEFAGNVSPDTTADVRNNLVWHWGNDGGGTILQCGAKVNVIGNFYSSPATIPSRQENAIVDDGCRVGSRALIYAADNVSNDLVGLDVNRVNNQRAPFAAPQMTTTSACVAAAQVLGGAGVTPRDSVDAHHLAGIALPPCAPE